MKRLSATGILSAAGLRCAFILTPALLATALTGCGGPKQERRTPPQESPPAPIAAGGQQPAPAPNPPLPPPRTGESGAPGGPLLYRRIPVLGPATLVSLRDSLGRAGFFEVQKVNRTDLAHIRQGDSLIVPARVPAPSPGDSLLYSPFPPSLAAAAAIPKLLLVSLRVQAFGAYEAGKLVRWGPTSTGRSETPTPAGLYHTNWKDKERISTVNEEWLLTWYVNLDNFMGISLHQYALPGRPASHSCVRLMEEDARWLYGWVEQWKLSPDGRTILAQGTPVVVFGEYAYGRRPPWMRLAEDPQATGLSPEEINRACEACAERDSSATAGPP